jgi:hypothetical protein
MNHFVDTLKISCPVYAGLCVRQKMQPCPPALPRLRLAPQGGAFASEGEGV